MISHAKSVLINSARIALPINANHAKIIAYNAHIRVILKHVLDVKLEHMEPLANLVINPAKLVLQEHQVIVQAVILVLDCQIINVFNAILLVNPVSLVSLTNVSHAKVPSINKLIRIVSVMDAIKTYARNVTPKTLQFASNVEMELYWLMENVRNAPRTVSSALILSVNSVSMDTQ